jgi:hypothetical protein
MKVKTTGSELIFIANAERKKNVQERVCRAGPVPSAALDNEVLLVTILYKFIDYGLISES